MGFKRCSICLNYQKKRDRRSFYQVPQCNFFSNSIEKQLIERRRAEWFKLLQTNDNKSKLYVCSDHFVSGKPAYVRMTEDIDWVPTKNLKNQPENVRSSLNSSNSRAIDSNNASPTDTDPPSNKQPKTESTNSNSQEKDKPPPSPIIEEPVKRKVIYSRPIQPVNGIWPRLTATIITPESINIPCNYSLLLNNQQVTNKSDEIVESVSNDVTEITVKKEIDSSTADADESVADCDLSAAYSFTSKLKEEKATQVTAEEIRQTFLLTASTQTVWK